MIRIIVVCHGKLAEGLASGVKLIMGEELCSDLIFYNFDDISFVELKEKITNKSEELLLNNENIIIFTDLLSGTPFNITSELAIKNEKVNLIYGVNLPMLISALFEVKYSNNSIDEIINKIVEDGRKAIGYFNKNIIVDEDLDEDL